MNWMMEKNQMYVGQGESQNVQQQGEQHTHKTHINRFPVRKLHLFLASLFTIYWKLKFY